MSRDYEIYSFWGGGGGRWGVGSVFGFSSRMIPTTAALGVD